MRQRAGALVALVQDRDKLAEERDKVGGYEARCVCVCVVGVGVTC